MKPKRTTLEDAQQAAEDLADILETLAQDYDANSVEKSMLKDMHGQVIAMAHRCESLATLRDFRGYKFAIIDPKTQEVRNATHEEAQRLILGFPPVEAGGIIGILNQYYSLQEQARNNNTTPPDPSNWDWLQKKEN